MSIMNKKFLEIVISVFLICVMFLSSVSATDLDTNLVDDSLLSSDSSSQSNILESNKSENLNNNPSAVNSSSLNFNGSIDKDSNIGGNNLNKKCILEDSLKYFNRSTDLSVYKNSSFDDSLISVSVMDNINSVHDFNGEANVVHDNKASSIVLNPTSNCYFVSQDFTTNPSSGDNFTVTFLSNSGSPIVGRELSLNLINPAGGSVSYWRTTNIDGVAKLPIYLAYPAIYTMEVSFAGDSSYSSAYASYSITISGKISTFIEDSGNSIVRGNNYKITLKDVNGNRLPGESIYVTLINNLGESITYMYTTNSNGIANMPINLVAAVWTLNIEYRGSNTYGSSGKTVQLTVINPPNVYPNTVNNGQFRTGLNEINTISDLSSYITGSNPQCARNSAIINLANSLTSSYINSWDKATVLFNWVRDNINYLYYSNSHKYAAGTLLDRCANCCDQANLVVALCRAAGIPAKYAHSKNCYFYNAHSYFGHVWAQIYVDGNWYSADTTSHSNSLGNIQNWNTNSFTLFNQYCLLPF